MFRPIVATTTIEATHQLQQNDVKKVTFSSESSYSITMVTPKKCNPKNAEVGVQPQRQSSSPRISIPIVSPEAKRPLMSSPFTIMVERLLADDDKVVRGSPRGRASGVPSNLFSDLAGVQVQVAHTTTTRTTILQELPQLADKQQVLTEAPKNDGRRLLSQKKKRPSSSNLVPLEREQEEHDLDFGLFEDLDSLLVPMNEHENEEEFNDFRNTLNDLQKDGDELCWQQHQEEDSPSYPRQKRRRVEICTFPVFEYPPSPSVTVRLSKSTTTTSTGTDTASEDKKQPEEAAHACAYPSSPPRIHVRASLPRASLLPVTTTSAFSRSPTSTTPICYGNSNGKAAVVMKRSSREPLAQAAATYCPDHTDTSAGQRSNEDSSGTGGTDTIPAANCSAVNHPVLSEPVSVSVSVEQGGGGGSVPDNHIFQSEAVNYLVSMNAVDAPDNIFQPEAENYLASTVEALRRRIVSSEVQMKLLKSPQLTGDLLPQFVESAMNVFHASHKHLLYNKRQQQQQDVAAGAGTGTGYGINITSDAAAYTVNYLVERRLFLDQALQLFLCQYMTGSAAAAGASTAGDCSGGVAAAAVDPNNTVGDVGRLGEKAVSRPPPIFYNVN